MTPASELIALADELREFTALRYSGDCKCGKCQLVPRETIIKTMDALRTAANQSASERPVVDALREALRSACERLQRFLDTFGDVGDSVTQADINDWLEPTAAVYPWPKALFVYRHDGNYWHGDISFARAPTDAEINALGAFLRDHHENTRPLATPPAQPAPAGGEGSTSSDGRVCGSLPSGESDPVVTQNYRPSELHHGKPDGAVREALRNMCDANKDYSLASNAKNARRLEQCMREANAKNARRLEQCMREAEVALHSPKIAAAETSPGDAYREVIDEALIVRHLGVAKGDAKAELNQILDWDVAAALDPAVSGRKA